MKIQQKIKTTTTHPDLVGKLHMYILDSAKTPAYNVVHISCKFNLTLPVIFLQDLRFYFAEFQVGNLETVQVGLHGLGPFNWVGKKVVLSLVQRNIREQSQI